MELKESVCRMMPVAFIDREPLNRITPMRGEYHHDYAGYRLAAARLLRADLPR